MQKYTDEQRGIYIRPMEETDTENILTWRNSEGVRKHFIYQEELTEQGHRHWRETMIDTGRAVQMIICDSLTHAPLGSVYLRDIDRQHRKGEYGIFLGEEAARGRGIGTAAAVLMLRYAFEELKLHKVYLRVYAENAAARRSYEKAGFVQEGYLRDEVFVRGRFCDMIWMAALAPEWRF